MFSTVVFSQVVTNQDITVNAESNAFLDSSSNTVNFEGEEDRNIGRGLVFPQTDLSTFQLNAEAADGLNFPTYYDGMIVYNTNEGGTTSDSSLTTQTENLTKGFYYFSNPDGKTNGSISGGKWVKILDGKELASGVTSGKFWSLNGNAGTTEVVVDKQSGKIKSGNFIGTTDEKSLTLATNNIPRLTIGKDGGLIKEDVGGTKFDFVLKVYGKAKFDKGIVTSASTYPDYVFDHYFTGKSAENPNYQFKSLSQVEKFIKENNHLPGVTSIKDLTKADGAYEVDNTQLSIQTLEKVEELYLHIIEQQKEIEALKAELQALKK